MKISKKTNEVRTVLLWGPCGALTFLVASMFSRNKGINHIRKQAGVLWHLQGLILVILNVNAIFIELPTRDPHDRPLLFVWPLFLTTVQIILRSFLWLFRVKHLLPSTGMLVHQGSWEAEQLWTQLLSESPLALPSFVSDEYMLFRRHYPKHFSHTKLSEHHSNAVG